jgi:hypothetical protein
VDGRRPRQRIVRCATGLPALLRPALRRYAEHELDAFDRLLLPTASSTTSTRVSSAPSISSRLAPRPFVRRLAPSTTEAGGPGVSRRPIRFDGWLRVGARRVVPRASGTTESLTPLSPSRGAASLVARLRSAESAKTVLCKRSVTEPPATTIRGAFHRRPPAHTRGLRPLSKTVT